MRGSRLADRARDYGALIYFAIGSSLGAGLGMRAERKLRVVIDRIDPIRGDIAELRHAMHAAIEKSASEQLRYLILAWGILLAAIVGLYGTMIALIR